MAKTRIIARFSNGYEDEYKGDRDVRAAWMIVDRESGEVLDSGHSLDIVRAQKTAENRVSDLGCGVDWDAFPSFYLPRSAQYLIGSSAKYLIEQVRKHGLADDIPVGKLKATEAFKRAKAANARRNAEKRSRVRIEVIEL